MNYESVQDALLDEKCTVSQRCYVKFPKLLFDTWKQADLKLTATEHLSRFIGYGRLIFMRGTRFEIIERMEGGGGQVRGQVIK